ncbi:MAG: AAA family ATPase [Kiritimatiellae bacterium]|nr:AAA family ATPase [Kiritimatiellia bacterium]
MKPREMYRITAVRLVEFHNLGTTTIEIPEGGHLFLLGDNGSGKTTILDAIHLVLTAGREMEFNSAARVAGAKDSGGRTIQGIVLRYNAVTGKTAREAGITYAAVELRSDAGRVCSLAVGLSASGMDVAYERWGGIASVPVAELPLTVEENGRLRASRQGEFKVGMASLAGGKYFAHINDYADTVGVRLFGGEAKYADVCKLLRTGKAYREIAARAANYDDLFRQLLEDPSRDTFEPLLKGLREIEESKGKLDQIDERATYLDELRRESERLGKLRVKADVTSWCEESRKRAEAERAVQSLSEAESGGKAVLAAAEREWAAIKGEAARLRERLAELRAKDKTGLIDREKASAQRFAEADRKAVEAERTYAEARQMADAAEKAEKDARAKRGTALRKCADDLIAAGKSANFAVGGVADALYGVKDDFADVFAEANAKVAAEREARSNAAFRTREVADAAVRETDARRAELDAIRARGENLPEVVGFEAARAEIRSQMLGARPVYELLEPASGCDARHLALLERLAGDEFLATWMVRPEEADQVRRIAWRSQLATDKMSVVPVCNGRDARCPSIAVRGEAGDVSVNDVAPWLGKYISFEPGGSDVEAIGLLARHLAAKVGPADGDFLSQKTWLFRGREGVASSAKPRLIGRKAREAEQARLEKAAEARLAEAEKAQKAAEKSASSSADALARLKQLENSLAAARDAAWREADAVRDAAGEAKRATERATLEGNAARERRGDADAAHEELEDIRVKMRAAGIDGSLEKRIASAEKAVRVKESEADEKRLEIGGVRGKLEGLAKAREAKENEATAATARAETFKARFAAHVPEGTEIDAFAAAECPQCVEEGADFVALSKQFAEEAGAAAEKIEQRVRDQKGEAYAFSFDRAANTITDRRGSPLADVLQDEKRRLDELRGVLDQKSREVFERIFMGEVMRRLYMDLLRITDLTGRIQRKLAGRRFGSNRYAFAITPVPEYEHFVELVRKGYALDSGGEKDELRDYLAQHREEILNAEIDAIPEIFDYRRWFRFELKVVTENEEGRVIDRKVKSMGSGGEQAVPNYLLILTVAEFLYHGGDGTEPPKASPILFDEAFYGIDAARRDQLLAFADDLGLQLFVSSPDQDGVKREIRHSVSLIVIKDENLDVHLTPVIWRNTPTQTDLLGGDSPDVGMTVKEETR